MSGERPGPADESGDDGQEARVEPATDAPFAGLRSASDIFGAPLREDEWPSRRERREAERVAQETGQIPPPPFVPTPMSAPEGDVVSGSISSAGASSGSGSGSSSVEHDDDSTQAVSMQQELDAPAEYDDDSTQAVSMQEELDAPAAPLLATSGEHDRDALGKRIPPPAAVPPSSTAPHPRSIELPFAASNRDARAAEARRLDDERRRVDPDGLGRDDVDWLGRATGSGPLPGAVPATTGVHDVLPPSDEPPSFTDLLRLPEGTGAAKPFDWTIADEDLPPAAQDGGVTFDTTALAVGSWSLTDEADDEGAVVAGETDEHPRDDDDDDDVPTPVPPVQPVPLAVAAEPEDVVDAELEPEPEPEVAVEPELELEPEQEPEPEPEPFPEPEPARPETAPTTAWSLTADEPEPEATPESARSEDDIDQSEWNGRETSDTSVIKDLFGTQAIRHITSDDHDDPDDPDAGADATRAFPAASTPQDQRRADGFPFPMPPGQGPRHDENPVIRPRGAVDAARTAAGGGAAGGADVPARDRGNFINEGFGRLQGEGQRGKFLLVVGAIVLIVVLLVAVFALTRWLLGNTIDEHSTPPTRSPAAAASVQRSAAPQAEASAPVTAATIPFATTAAAAGEHSWRDLAGGECLQPYSDPWADTFTVVDCTASHQGQLTFRTAVDGDAWPGLDALRARVASTCQTAAALDLGAASSVTDVQVQGTYPPDQAAWDAGDRALSCFASRADGAAITRSLAPTA